MLIFHVTEVYYLYWIKSKEMDDIETQGYVGVTRDPLKRFNQHLHKVTGAKEISSFVSDKIAEIGIHNIECHVIANGTKEDMYKLEKQLRPNNNIGWNIARGGGNTTTGPKSQRVYKMSEEAKRKLSKAHKYRKELGYVSPFKGMKNRWSEDMKKHIGSFHKGKTIPKEQVEALAKKLREYHPTMKFIALFHKDKSETISCMYRSISEASRMSEIGATSIKGAIRQRSDRWILGEVKIDFEMSHPKLGFKVNLAG